MSRTRRDRPPRDRRRSRLRRSPAPQAQEPAHRGVAGGAEKCHREIERLGPDACSDGFDTYFEIVADKTLDAVPPQMDTFGRIPLCGAIVIRNPTTTGHHNRLPATRPFAASSSPTDSNGSPASSRRRPRLEGMGGRQPRSCLPAFIDLLEGRNPGKVLAHTAAWPPRPWP